MDDLNARQRKVLQRIRLTLRNKTSVAEKTNPTIRSIVEWADRHYLLGEGVAVGGHTIFTNTWVDAIESALLSCGYAPIQVRPKGDRIDNAALSIAEDKGQSDNPRKYRALIYAYNGAAGVKRQDLHDCLRWQCIDVDWRTLDLAAHSHLVMVENLTVFYRLNEVKITIPAEALIVYRGDSVYAAGFSGLVNAWQATRKPCLAMVDIDGYSLCMIQSMACLALAVPSLQRFQQLANPAHAPSEQQAYLDRLERNGPLAPYVDWMQRHQVGLRQEWMMAEELQWVSLG